MSINVIGHPQRTRIYFFYMSGVVSESLHIVPSCCGSFRFLKTMTSHNVLTCKFTKNELHVTFCHKKGQALLQSGTTLMYYKVGQVLLQNGAAFLCFPAGQVVLQSEAIVAK